MEARSCESCGAPLDDEDTGTLCYFCYMQPSSPLKPHLAGVRSVENTDSITRNGLNTYFSNGEVLSSGFVSDPQKRHDIVNLFTERKSRIYRYKLKKCSTCKKTFYPLSNCDKTCKKCKPTKKEKLNKQRGLRMAKKVRADHEYYLQEKTFCLVRDTAKKLGFTEDVLIDYAITELLKTYPVVSPKSEDLESPSVEELLVLFP